MSPSEGPLRAGGGHVLLDVHAQPGSGREGIAGLHGGRLRVRTTAPPADGKANARLVEVLAEAFGVRRDAIELVKGVASRRKTFALGGLALDDARRRLDVALGSEASR